MSSLASTATVGTNMFVNNPGSMIKGQGLKGVSAQNGLGAVKGDAGTLLSDDYYDYDYGDYSPLPALRGVQDRLFLNNNNNNKHKAKKIYAIPNHVGKGYGGKGYGGGGYGGGGGGVGYGGGMHGGHSDAGAGYDGSGYGVGGSGYGVGGSEYGGGGSGYGGGGSGYGGGYGGGGAGYGVTLVKNNAEDSLLDLIDIDFSTLLLLLGIAGAAAAFFLYQAIVTAGRSIGWNLDLFHSFFVNPGDKLEPASGSLEQKMRLEQEQRLDQIQDMLQPFPPSVTEQGSEKEWKSMSSTEQIKF